MTTVNNARRPALVSATGNNLETSQQRASKDTATEAESVQITLRMSKEQLERLSAVAKRQGIPRASYIKRAVFIQLEEDEAK